mgnify:FL=1|jgi:hypothetical protein|tara:strand:+ start:4468 stop:6597 length:2130 start_codon:yes stop_codon:yes gene_type:complete
MSALLDIDGYETKGIKIDPNGTEGDIMELHGLLVVLPKKPKRSEILFHEKPKAMQMWERIAMPEELQRIRSMDEWLEKPAEFRKKFRSYIEQEFQRRRNGVWFYNNGVPTYITGRHYMFLQWSKIDIGYPSYLAFQREIFLHMAACEADPRCFGQLYTKCRRSGYTNVCSAVLVDEASQVKEKLLGIQSKTGKDAQENIFMKKVVAIFRSYPFFFKPIQDGTTNPRMELAFREPSKRITKNNKTSQRGDALNTVINWKNTTNNAYDGEKLHMLYLDEAGKWEKPTDIREAWRIERTCLIVGKRIVGNALVGSTVNPMNKGGDEYRGLWEDSDPNERNNNGRTRSGLYRIFIPAYEALEGFFDKYGNPVVDNPEKEIEGLDGDPVDQGSRVYLKNERHSFKDDPSELNEIIRQFPFTEDEAFRDSIEGSLFNIGKIYQQIEHNDNLYPNPVVQGNFVWRKKDEEVVFSPDPNGRFRVAWLPPDHLRNKKSDDRGKRIAPNSHIGVGGVDSYDLDATVDGRGSKGALHMYNKFNMDVPSNMFVVEYASRPDLASIFYEDVLMCAFFYGYPLLIENNKYGIARYFESRGYDGYLMDRPDFLKNPNSSSNVRTKGIPSNSQDVIQSHAQSIEAYIHDHVGINPETADFGKMYFNRTLEDWIGYKIDKRTKFDLTISSGLALLASQKAKKKEKPKADFNDKKFFRTYKPKAWHF